jgi:hypothetical protein
MDSITYNHKTVVAQRTSPIGDGGLSTPHTNFGGGGLGSDTQPGRPFGRSGRASQCWSHLNGPSYRLAEEHFNGAKNNSALVPTSTKSRFVLTSGEGFVDTRRVVLAASSRSHISMLLTCLHY